MTYFAPLHESTLAAFIIKKVSVLISAILALNYLVLDRNQILLCDQTDHGCTVTGYMQECLR